VVRRTIYTTQPTEYGVITAAIEEVQGSTEHPAQTIVGITGLAVPGLLIAVDLGIGSAACSPQLSGYLVVWQAGLGRDAKGGRHVAHQRVQAAERHELDDARHPDRVRQHVLD
jgi:hypothetical protein